MLTSYYSSPSRSHYGSEFSSHRRTPSAATYEHFDHPMTDAPRNARESITSPRSADMSRKTSSLGEAMSDSSLSHEHDKEAYCMFVKNCDTGSQLRKAISHLFGRNKSCTLKIPKHVWVYYCRKHYQRVRYRNAKTYPVNQMELVKLQIRRLQSWSEENKKSGDGPYIKVWTLSLRKREQNRIDSGMERVEDRRGATSSAVPDWLIQRVGTGYSTDQMLDVADLLYEEIKAGRLTQIPEIEFLPDIVEDTSTVTKVGRSRKMVDTSRALKRRMEESTNDSTRVPYGILVPIECSDLDKRSHVAKLPPLAVHFGQRGDTQSIPRIQPPEYRRHGSYGGYVTPPSYHQPLSATSEPEDVYYDRNGGRYAHQQSLPPLHSHLSTPPHQIRGVESHGGHAQPPVHTHSRSSSAYSLASSAPVQHRPNTSSAEPRHMMHSQGYAYDMNNQYTLRDPRMMSYGHESHYEPSHRAPISAGRSMPPLYRGADVGIRS